MARWQRVAGLLLTFAGLKAVSLLRNGTGERARMQRDLANEAGATRSLANLHIGEGADEREQGPVDSAGAATHSIVRRLPAGQQGRPPSGMPITPLLTSNREAEQWT